MGTKLERLLGRSKNQTDSVQSAISNKNNLISFEFDGNEYFDFLQAGGPTIIGSNDDVVKEKVKELLDDCGPSTGLFHPYEYKLAKKISE